MNAPPSGPPEAPGGTRKIIHVDMDCFYAAVEEREQPHLRGLPLAVGGSHTRRGVLTTCNYEARKFGVHSAMPTFQALAKCRSPDRRAYPLRPLPGRERPHPRDLSWRARRLVEPLSLDEAYLDVSHLDRPATEIAREIRARIHALTGLTASAGIAPNKMLAKIASDRHKPDGQYTIKPALVSDFMLELPARKIPGIGEVTSARLASELGVETCGQLQQFSRADLQNRFGKFGFELYDRCRGIDGRPVEPNRIRKSLSNENTYPVNLTTLDECRVRLRELHTDLLADLEKHGGRAVTKLFVKLRFADFTHTTVERGGTEPDFSAYETLLDEGWSRREGARRVVRLLGVGVRFEEERDGTADKVGSQLAFEWENIGPR